MSDSMFFVLLAALFTCAAWLSSKLDGAKERIQGLENRVPDLDELKGASKEGVLEALEEHNDPYPIPGGPYDDGYEARLRHAIRRME